MSNRLSISLFAWKIITINYITCLFYISYICVYLTFGVKQCVYVYTYACLHGLNIVLIL